MWKNFYGFFTVGFLVSWTIPTPWFSELMFHVHNLKGTSVDSTDKNSK